MRQALLLLLTLIATAAPLPAPRDRTKGDLKAMEGEWEAVYAPAGSMAATQPRGPWKGERRGIRLVISGDRLTHYQVESVVGMFTIKLDASRKPRWIDATVHPPRSEGWARRQYSDGWLGLYRLEGDTLTICDVDHHDGGRRPGRITGDETWHTLTVLRRVRK